MKTKYIFTLIISVFAFNCYAQDANLAPTSIASTEYVQNIVQQLNNTKADKDTVVSTTGNQDIDGVKNIIGTLTISSEIADNSNDSTVPTTEWTTKQLGKVPFGSKTSSSYANIWIE